MTTGYLKGGEGRMMIFILDDEKLAAQSLAKTVRSVLGEEQEIKVFHRSADILEENAKPPDLCFLDIEMPGMNGMEAAGVLKGLYPQVKIVFVTAYSDYALGAWGLGVDGYLLKPVSVEDMSTLLGRILNKQEDESSGRNKLTAVCFGKFEVFYNGKIVRFKRKRAKEMLGYLICAKGAGVSTGELCGVLWEDANELRLKKTYVRQYAQSIREALSVFGLENVLIHNRDSYAVDTSLISCDYYRYLNGDENEINAYNGEFMSQYEWSELVNNLDM